MMPYIELCIELCVDYIFVTQWDVFNMKDVQMVVPYISTQLNLKNSSPIIFNKILCKTIEIGFRNSSKMEFCVFGSEICYA